MLANLCFGIYEINVKFLNKYLIVLVSRNAQYFALLEGGEAYTRILFLNYLFNFPLQAWFQYRTANEKRNITTPTEALSQHAVQEMPNT